MKKSEHMPVWLRKWFFSCKRGQLVEAGNKAQQKCAPATEECNRYDLTADPCSRLANHTDWSRWFAISSSHLFAVPVSVLWIKKSKQLNLYGRNAFAGSHTEHQ
jgi:hypothetical protein